MTTMEISTMVLRENYNGVVMLNSFIQRRLSNFPAIAIKSNRSARHVSSLLPRKFTPVFHTCHPLNPNQLWIWWGYHSTPLICATHVNLQVNISGFISFCPVSECPVNKPTSHLLRFIWDTAHWDTDESIMSLCWMLSHIWVIAEP